MGVGLAITRSGVAFVAVALIALVGLVAPCGADDDFEGAAQLGIVDFQLDNGLTVVVAVRPELDLAAVNLTVDYGSVDDPAGAAGMAHVLEHVTLAGSERIGSVDLAKERKALARLDRAESDYRQALAEAERDGGVEPSRLAALRDDAARARDEAAALAERGEILGGRLEARGAIGINATTGPDATQYFTRIPADQVDYWMELEADRLRHPILRRFHSEREVVLREIETLTGGRPTAQERLLGEAFADQAVANPVAGRPAEIDAFERADAFEHFRLRYRPEHVTISVVGNVRPRSIRESCERHFGAWRPEPVPAGEREARAGRASAALEQPFFRAYNSIRSPLVFLGFPAASPGTVEEAAQLALAELLMSDELSPLKTRIMGPRPLAWDAGASMHYPSEKVPGLFLVHVYGQSGVRHQRLVEEAQLALVGLGDVDDQELQGAIALAQMRLIADLEDPAALASLLAKHEAVHDDWALPYRRLQALSRLRPIKLRQHAEKLFGFERATILWPDGSRARWATEDAR